MEPHDFLPNVPKVTFKQLFYALCGADLHAVGWVSYWLIFWTPGEMVSPQLAHCINTVFCSISSVKAQSTAPSSALQRGGLVLLILAVPSPAPPTPVTPARGPVAIAEPWGLRGNGFQETLQEFWQIACAENSSRHGWSKLCCFGYTHWSQESFHWTPGLHCATAKTGRN